MNCKFVAVFSLSLPLIVSYCFVCFSKKNTCLFIVFLDFSSLLSYIAWNLVLSSFRLHSTRRRENPWFSAGLSGGFPRLVTCQGSWTSFTLGLWISSTTFDFKSLCFTVSRLFCWDTYLSNFYPRGNFSERQMGGNFWVLECLQMRHFLPSLLTDSLAVNRIPGSKPFTFRTYRGNVVKKLKSQSPAWDCQGQILHFTTLGF